MLYFEVWNPIELHLYYFISLLDIAEEKLLC